MRERSKLIPAFLSLPFWWSVFQILWPGLVPVRVSRRRWFIITGLDVRPFSTPARVRLPALVLCALACLRLGLSQSDDLLPLLAGRTISALSGTATIAIVYLAGKRAYCGDGTTAAAFFACTVTIARVHIPTIRSTFLSRCPSTSYQGQAWRSHGITEAGACICSPRVEVHGLFLFVRFFRAAAR